MDAHAPQCIVCYTDLTHPCVTPCAHNEVCGTCHLRLRYLHSDKKCPICKQENQQIIVDRFENVKLFEEYPLWGDELGADYIFRDDVGMFFPKDYYDAHILSLFGNHCGVCNNYDGINASADNSANNNQDPRNNHNQQQQQGKKNNRAAITPVKSLLDHLRNKHRLTLCEFCIDHKRDFVALLPRFTPSQLKSHMASGDSIETGFRGHPLCEFCRPKRFYDLTHLHMHLQQDHYKCHVCETQGLANQYFRDYAALEKHFDRQHFLCKDPQCAAARFMVFENEIDLRAHELSVHGGTSTGSTKIQLQFRVRREGYSGAGYESQTVPSDDDFQYGIDGEAFVPEGLPQQERGPNEETSHPLHFQRTEEFRTLAAGIRAAQQVGTAEEAFPSLGEAAAQSDGIRMGWTAAGNLQRFTRPGVVTNSVEQFPSLTSASSGNANTSVAGKLRAGGVSGSRQFSAMRNAAMGNAPAPTTNDWASQAARPASGRTQAPSFAHSSAGSSMNRLSDLGQDNFPSLGGASRIRASYPSFPSNSASRSSTTTQNVSSITASDFPSLGAASKTRATYPVNASGGSRVEARAPPLNNAVHFPPPPKVSTKSNSVREKLLGERKSAPVNNLTNFPPPQSNQSMKQGMATVEEMKASLGLTNYKELKNLTKQFAADEIAPDAYVDRAAALFDNGYGDSDFWLFLPALLISCPNQTSAGQALRYVDDLRSAHQANTAPPATTSWTAPPPLSASSGNVSVNNASAYQRSLAPPPRAAIRPVGVAIQPVTSLPVPKGAQGKNKGAWGNTGASSVVRAKASPVSVAVAAANQNPQNGSATSYMAKESKLQSQRNHVAKPTPGMPGGGQNKKKKKQIAELRALAFGK